ncbi:MAG: FadR family transcriptional regulator [Myxococcales bacterium]|nr:MAG: FadR family transcriptional regulator [Myxococcales bacterium]
MSLESRADVTLEATLDPVGRDLILDAIDAIEAVEARQVIELAIVRLAAVRRTEADLERLRALLDGMRECRNRPAAFAEFDFALHVALSKAARNTLLASSLSTLHD